MYLISKVFVLEVCYFQTYCNVYNEAIFKFYNYTFFSFLLLQVSYMKRLPNL